MRRLPRTLLILALCLVVLLFLIQWVGSLWATATANRTLAALPDYSGRVDRITLALWRGTVEAHDFQLFRRGREIDGSLVEVRQAFLSLAWSSILRGRFGGNGGLDGVEVVMLKQTDEAAPERDAESAAPLVREWQAVLREAFPLEVNRFEIKQARIRFEDRTVDPPVKLEIDRFHLLATDLSNRPQGEALPARVTVQARLAGTGHLDLEVRADPSAAEPRFSTRMEVKGLALPPLREFLLAYALIDVRAGTFEMASEIEAADGRYEGYVKPFFENLEFESIPDPDKNLVQRAATRVASAVTGLLENERDQVATKAPFEGNFENNDLDLWTTIENLLRNAFVEALREGIDNPPTEP